MQVLSLAWVGTRTTAYPATLAFFRDVLGLAVQASETDFAVLQVPDGATVEVFGPASRYNQHLTHPVAGLRVADLAESVAELEAAGVEIVLPVQGGEDRRWVHFRAPDGFVYELMEDRTAGHGNGGHWAAAFAAEWIEAWNARDLEAVLEHIADDVVFTSPTAARFVPESGGTVRGKDALRSYWTIALEGHPDLHFELIDVYVGVETVVLHYRNEAGALVNEVLTFRDGLVAVGHATHVRR
jgi:catechol 2,3-dioxygenase-like lactoylglutathione lyase family enzyme